MSYIHLPLLLPNGVRSMHRTSTTKVNMSSCCTCCAVKWYIPKCNILYIIAIMHGPHVRDLSPRKLWAKMHWNTATPVIPGKKTSGYHSRNLTKQDIRRKWIVILLLYVCMHCSMQLLFYYLQLLSLLLLLLPWPHQAVGVIAAVAVALQLNMFQMN